MGWADKINERRTRIQERWRRWYWMPTAVLLLGVLSMALLIWANQINRRQRMHFAFADALMDLRIHVATSHLWLEEGISGRSEAEIDRAWSDLREAIRLSQLLLNGGISDYAIILEPLKDPDLRNRTEDLRRLLSQFEMNFLERFQNPKLSREGSLAEFRGDEIFDELQGRSAELERIIEESLIADYAGSRRLFFGVFLVWSCIVVSATTGLWNRERRRKAAEAALRKTHADLENQAEELRRHREHLMDLVGDRTKDLRTANIALQEEIVERKKTEEALRKSEEQYRMLVDTMNEGFMILNNKGVLTYVNESFCKMLACSRDELLGRRVADFLSEADREIIAKRSRGLDRDYHHRDEVTFKKKGGDNVFTTASPRPICDKDRNVVGSFAVITDITERIALQAATIRTAQLVSLGEVAAGVAHEINSPINGIINYARILCDQCERACQAHEVPNRILKEGRRIADTVRALLLFARGGKREKKLVHVRDILSDSLGLMGSEMRYHGIEVLTDLPVDLARIFADSQEIQQVFMNIISNARDALNQKHPGRHEEKRLQIHARHLTIGESPYVRITFHDRGLGIPAGIIDKVRQPFFSTKPKGKGTGLGLSISDGIIRDHGGKLTIESVEGEFTRVAIDLPAGGENGEDSCH